MSEILNESIVELELQGDVAGEFETPAASRTWYHYLLLAAAVIFAAVSIGFVGTIFWSSLPTWLHHTGTLLGGSAWSSPIGPSVVWR